MNEEFFNPGNSALFKKSIALSILFIASISLGVVLAVGTFNNLVFHNMAEHFFAAIISTLSGMFIGFIIFLIGGKLIVRQW